MFTCERCGTSFGSIQAAVLEFCPRCKARDRVSVPLIVRRVKDSGLLATGCPEPSGDRVAAEVEDSLEITADEEDVG